MSTRRDRKIKICVAQTPPQPGSSYAPTDSSTSTFDKDPNLASVRSNLGITAKLAKLAADDDAELVLFPEYWLQGLVQDRAHLVESAPDLKAKLVDLAKTYNISIAGTIVEPGPQRKAGHHHKHPASRADNEKDLPEEEDDDGPEATDEASEGGTMTMVNVAYVFEGGTGKEIGRYVKRNLWISEREYLTKGEDEHEIFEVHGVKMGLLICWDLAKPAAAASLAKQGVDIILVPTFWTGNDSEPTSLEFNPPADYEKSLIQSLCYTRAFETETALLMCNAGHSTTSGPSERKFIDGVDYIGGSGAWVPFKGKLEGRKLDVGEVDADVRVYEVDLGLLDVARGVYKIREDWKEGYNVIA